MRALVLSLGLMMFCSPAVAAEWPESWSTGGSAEVSEAPWWHELGDPQLVAVVDRALSGNPDLRAARAMADMSRAGALTQGSMLFPSISANARASIAPMDSLGFGFGVTIPVDPDAPKNYSSGQATLDAQWQLDVFGRSLATWHAAQSDANAAGQDSESRDRQVASVVASAYLDVVAARQRVEVFERQLKTNEALLQAVKLRYQGGDVGSLDVLQQQQQVASSRANLPTARLMLQTTEQRLAILQGLLPTTPVEAASALPELTTSAQIGRPADLEDNRSDLRATAQRLRGARDRRWAAVGGFLPTVGASAQYGSQFIDRGESVSQSFWNVGGSVSMPIFNGGRALGGAKQAQAALRAAQANHESVQLTAMQQVESALIREQRQRELIQALDEQFVAADQAWTVAREQYLRGLTPYINLQTTLARRQLAEVSRIQGARDLLAARIAVHDAVGGTWVAIDPKDVVR